MSCSVIRIPYNGGLIFGRALLSGGGAYYRREFCVLKMCGLITLHTRI